MSYCDLFITVGPIIDKSRQYAKAAGEHGHTIFMTCKATGAPDVNFRWKKVGFITACSCNSYVGYTALYLSL